MNMDLKKYFTELVFKPEDDYLFDDIIYFEQDNLLIYKNKKFRHLKL